MAAIELLTDLPIGRDERSRADVAAPQQTPPHGLVLLCGDTWWREDGRAALRGLQIELALAGWCSVSATHRPLDGLARLDARDVAKDLVSAIDATWDELLVREGAKRLVVWGVGSGASSALAVAARSAQAGRPARAVVLSAPLLALAGGPLPEDSRRRQQTQRFLADDGASLAADRLDVAALAPLLIFGEGHAALPSASVESLSEAAAQAARLDPWLLAAEAADSEELRIGEPRFLSGR